MAYKALRGFEYPKSLAIRNRLRSGVHVPWEERGEMVSVRPGAAVQAPSDLLESWLHRGLIEEVHHDA